MSRRSKPDQPPPFVMVVEKGRLVAENPWDFERLTTWKDGTRLSVRITSDRNDRFIRWWWATLGQIVKATGIVPSKEVLHAEIKGDLGIIHMWKDDDGRRHVAEKSLTEIEDDEVEIISRQFGDWLYDKTGIDIDQWNRETPAQGAGISNEQSDAPQAPREASDQAGGDFPQLSPPADNFTRSPSLVADGGQPSIPSSDADGAKMEGRTSASPERVAQAGMKDVQSEQAANDFDPPAGEHMAGDQAGGGDSSHPPPVDEATAQRMREAVDKFIRTATDKDLPDAYERQQMVVVCKDLWKTFLPDHPDFVMACTSEADKVVKGKRTPEDARKLLLARIP